MLFAKDSYEVQKLLSEIIDKPFISSQELVKTVFPGKSVPEHGDTPEPLLHPICFEPEWLVCPGRHGL